VEFVEQDVRDGIPQQPFDIYLSCGVPYSHLTPPELQAAMINIFAAVRYNQSRSAIIVDVLGRYSIEWPIMWSRERWPYRMNFFSTDATMENVDMSVYTAASLSTLIDGCARSAGIALESKQFFDRSITVGRHTTTLEYNKSLQPLRSHINALYKEQYFDFSLLALPPVPDMDCVVTQAFHNQFRIAWNGNVTAAANLQKGLAAREVADHLGYKPLLLRRAEGSSDCTRSPITIKLADTLKQLEWEMQPGLGVGHSLIGVFIVDGRRPA